jgi:hypothetical protein
MKYFIIALCFISFESHASLRRAPKIIARQVEKKLFMIENAFKDNSPFQTPILYKESDASAYYLKRIRLQYTPFVAFKVPFVELKVLPMIEFRWTRKNPKGWSNYKIQ